MRKIRERGSDHSDGYRHIVVGVDGGTEAWAALDTAAVRAGAPRASTYVVEGDPAARILEHASREHCDLIVMGCRSRVGPHPATSASTTTAVAERAQVPVLMVRAISGD